MGIDAESGDRFDQPIGRPTGEEVGDGGKSGQQEQQADHDRDDETDDLIAGHGRGEAANCQIGAS